MDYVTPPDGLELLCEGDFSLLLGAVAHVWLCLTPTLAWAEAMPSGHELRVEGLRVWICDWPGARLHITTAFGRRASAAFVLSGPGVDDLARAIEARGSNPHALVYALAQASPHFRPPEPS